MAGATAYDRTVVAEGWYRDPYERHMDRWFSAGQPTALVRDDHIESRDEPPAEAFTQPLIPVDVFERRSANDDVDRVETPSGLDGVELHVAVWEEGYIRRFGMRDPRERRP